MKLRILTVMLVGTVMLTFGSGALAAGPRDSKATMMDVDTCVPLIDGGTVCIEMNGVINETVTPSGLVSYVANYREEISVIEGGQVTWNETSDERFHSLTMDDVLKEINSRSRFTVTSFGDTYCVQYHLHGTNGQDQFVRIDFC